MATKLEALINNPDLAESLTQNGREAALRSSWNSVGPMWASVFDAARQDAKSAEIEQLA
jgi:hypothetical protein